MKDLDFAFYSDVGGRTNNEDSYLSEKISNGYLFIVADGLGGHGCGEKASGLAVDMIKEFLENNENGSVLEAVGLANSKVLAMQAEYSSNMKTTIALAYVLDKKTVIAHVGDSRVYLFKKGKIVHQTIDHSASQLAVTIGEISSADIRKHKNRHILLRAIGAGNSVKVEISEIENGNFDALLLCSDGFWEYVHESEMESKLARSESADEWLIKMRLIQLERAPERCDNNTAIAVIL